MFLSPHPPYPLKFPKFFDFAKSAYYSIKTSKVASSLPIFQFKFSKMPQIWQANYHFIWGEHTSKKTSKVVFWLPNLWKIWNPILKFIYSGFLRARYLSAVESWVESWGPYQKLFFIRYHLYIAFFDNIYKNLVCFCYIYKVIGYISENLCTLAVISMLVKYWSIFVNICVFFFYLRLFLHFLLYLPTLRRHISMVGQAIDLIFFALAQKRDVHSIKNKFWHFFEHFFFNFFHSPPHCAAP